MKDKILLLHGWGGSDFPHWQSWLASEIARDYGIVSFLELKNPNSPIKKEWKQQVKEHLKDFKPDVVLCHSIANLLWFDLCCDSDMQEVKKLFLVAPPSLIKVIEDVKTFYPVTAPKSLYAKEATLVVSSNDPYMPLQEAKELQKTLNIPMKILQNAGHINADSGYGKFNWILKQIQEK
jgi:hypothetical protein